MTTCQSCQHCTSAQTDPTWGGIQSNCHGCDVRSMAVGLSFFETRQAGTSTEIYRRAMQSVFGEGARAAHSEVVAEYKRLQALKREGGEA